MNLIDILINLCYILIKGRIMTRVSKYIEQ